MWNYDHIFHSLLILVLFLCFYMNLPRISLKINKAFVNLIIICCGVIISDILSSYADNNNLDFSIASLYLVNGLFFVLYFLRGYLFFDFSVCAINQDGKIVKTGKWLSRIPFLICCGFVVTAPLNHLFFYIDEMGYHRGSLYPLMSIEMLVYIGFSYIVCLAHNSGISRKRDLNSIYWYNFILFLGSVFRVLFPYYLLMDTFCIMAIIVIYLSFENPDFYLEGHTWIFNSKALRSYLRENYSKRNFKVLTFIIHNYREIKELYGAPQMDEGIRLIGDFLRKAYGNQTVFYCRSGRFVILGDAAFDCAAAYEYIADRFTRPWIAENTELYLDIGAAQLKFGGMPIPFEEAMNVLMTSFEVADSAVGKDIVVVDDELMKKFCEQTDIKRNLEYAIEHNNVEIFLQPIISCESGKLVGAEALSRIRNKEGKIIPPNLFIPIAEKNGRINELGEQVFAKACRFIRDNDIEKLGLSWINVNLSPIQLMNNNLADLLGEYISKYDINPEVIHLEITEEAMVDEHLWESQIEIITGKNFKFVLDDYGKGYSNMSRLKKCPFVNIKLDMSIVWDYCKHNDELLPDMVSSFRKMGFEITAEGIENQEMADKMKDIGVNYLQGYYYSKPLQCEEFISFCKSRL